MVNLKFFNIVIIGRPNVGKSSIFNFLVSKNEAKIEDSEGTTVDWRSKKIGNLVFWDSPGSFSIESFPSNIKIDLVFFVVDNNILEVDKKNYLKLKHNFDKIFVIINKIDKGEDLDYSYFDKNIKISMKSRFNLLKLKSFIMEFYQDVDIRQKKTWAIIGKPNVGKSTLLNKLIKNDLHKVANENGTTKEILPVEYNEYVFLDTPGQRGYVEYPKYGDIFGFIFVTDLLDEKQDLKMISKILSRNKPIFIVINKIDLIIDRKIIEHKIKRLINFFQVKIIKISCLKDLGITKVLNVMQNIEKNYKKRITTNILNKWLKQKIHNIEPRLKFISQIDVAPPKFFCDYKLTQDKERMLKKTLANDFDFNGLNIKIYYH